MQSCSTTEKQLDIAIPAMTLSQVFAVAQWSISTGVKLFGSYGKGLTNASTDVKHIALD